MVNRDALMVGAREPGAGTPRAAAASPAAHGSDDPPGFLPRDDFDRLFDLLRADGRTVVGPTLADGAIVYAEIAGTADLPGGQGDRQSPGAYRLEPTGRARLFDFAVGPTSWKRYTFPPRVPLTRGRRVDGQVTFRAIEQDPPRLAFVGVRACDIAALLVQDRVFTRGPVPDADYVARREAAVVVAVECVSPSDTCFCTSMGTGPEVTASFDLALTELDEGFVVRSGSDVGRFLAYRLSTRPATADEIARARTDVAGARARMGDPIPTAGLPERLVAAADSPHWAEVAERCLACTNCTLVCPTCFCTSVTQSSDLAGSEAIAGRVWDSCFTLGFARVAGGNFRPRVQDRYRQWLTHKFAGWWEQFGTSGCVGCGRCITWCPVGIDVRAELMAVAGPDRGGVETVEPPAPVAPTARPAENPPISRVPIISRTVRVSDVRHETPDVVTLHLQTEDASLLTGRPGQFVMAALPGISAPPISVSRFHHDGFELTIRAAGAATRALCSLRPGETLGVTGPLGRGWPLEAAYGRDVIIVTGGIGLAPLRPLLDAVLQERERFGAARLLYGARTPSDRLFADELSELAGRDDLEVHSSVDRAGPEWLGRVGVVTTLLEQASWDGSRAVAFVCGPERMMEATADVLGDLGVARDRIWVTMERHMACGVGLCGHCQLGPSFVCRDGPVFSLGELGRAFGREGW